MANDNFGATTVSGMKFYNATTGEVMFSGSGTIDLNSPFTFTTVKERTPMQKMGIDKLTFNNPATIIHHLDGKKTVVKATDNDSFDPIYGFLLAYFQKTSGMTKTQANKFIDDVNELAVKQELEKGKKKVRVKNFDILQSNEDTTQCGLSLDDFKMSPHDIEFKVGDRVKCTSGAPRGLIGTIAFDDGSGRCQYVVEFDNDFRYGHSCEGFYNFKGVKHNRGFWLGVSSLVLVK